MVSPGRQLPAIRFDEQRSRVDDSLPRLDIGAFVGFATAGPFDLPVQVDSVAGFRDVFGSDVPLGRRPDGTRARGHLGRSVEAFFASGGRVCWVVRVGSEQGATRFPLRGVVVDEPGRAWRTAELVGRSGGSFADAFTVQPVLELTRLTPSTVDVDPSGSLTVSVREPVGAGDLLRLDFGDGVVALARVGASTPDSGSGPVVVERTWWLEPADIPSGSPVQRVTPAGSEAVADAVLDPDPDLSTGALLTVPHDVVLHQGDVLMADVGGQQYVTVIDDPPVRAAQDASVPFDPVTSDGRILSRLRLGTVWRLGEEPPVPSPLASQRAVRVDRMTLSVVVFESDRIEHRLGGLGLAPAHDEYAGALPTDAALFSRLANLPLGDAPGSGVVDAEPALGPLWTAARAPRFPLAGTGATAAETWLPLGAALAPDARRAGLPGTDVDPDESIVRDGVALVTTDLFLDEHLAALGTATLLTTATALAHLADPPRRLRGIHSLLAVDAVTLLSVPDAAQPCWQRTVIDVPPMPPGLVLEVVRADGGLLASWSPAVPGATYRLEGSAKADFEAATVPYEGAVTSFLVPDGHRCPEVLHLRVRAQLGHDLGPWSNTVSAWHPAEDFERCADLPLPLDLSALDSPPDPDHVRLVWTPPDPVVEIEVSHDPTFADGTLAEVASGLATFRWPAVLTTYFRARRLGGPEGPGAWSNTVVVAPPGRTTWVASPWSEAATDRLRDIHRGMLRLGAARGDVFSVLSVAEDMAEPDLVTHVTRLVDSTDERDEGAILTFGALYHPWVVSPIDEARALGATPPDGWALGAIAKGSLERGAWIAPANVVLADVVALHRPVGASARVRLTEQGVNVIWPEAAGISISTADTLSLDEDLRPISVRRLLILLRRLALREGDTYVFAPHDARFRALVRSQWERYLLALFRRGAFAGARPSEAFDLRVDASVNPPGAVDQGRFVIEVAVAPSRPLEFIRVRLVTTRNQVDVEEVVAA